MTKAIIIAASVGVASGYFFIPASFINISGNLLIVGLCILLFFVGVDIGIEGTVVQNFKKVGLRILIFPFAILLGTFLFAMLASVFLPISVKESLAIGAGLGWYTLAPVILAEYSTSLSAISFIHNVARELLGIIFIPIVAKKIGYVECTALPGAAAMDVCLPVVEQATKGDIVVYSFVSGVVLSIMVPILVPFIAGL